MLLKKKVANSVLAPVCLEASAKISVESLNTITDALNKVFFRFLKYPFEVFIPEKSVVWLDEVPERLHYWANGICPGDLIDQTEPGASVGDVLWRWEVSNGC